MMQCKVALKGEEQKKQQNIKDHIDCKKETACFGDQALPLFFHSFVQDDESFSVADAAAAVKAAAAVTAADLVLSSRSRRTSLAKRFLLCNNMTLQRTDKSHKHSHTTGLEWRRRRQRQIDLAEKWALGRGLKYAVGVESLGEFNGGRNLCSL